MCITHHLLSVFGEKEKKGDLTLEYPVSLKQSPQVLNNYIVLGDVVEIELPCMSSSAALISRHRHGEPLRVSTSARQTTNTKTEVCLVGKTPKNSGGEPKCSRN